MNFTAIGLMSGTSMDGVDVALIETDGEGEIRLGGVRAFPYGEADRALLRRALADAALLEDRGARPGALAEAEAMVTQRHAAAVRRFLEIEKLEPSDINVVGFHGQTVLHRPQAGLTVQIGDGAALARDIAIDVAYDFRAADVADGGQGAPLVPVFHSALAAAAGFEKPVVIVNIGGVSNITFCAPGQTPVACDAGPGNALLDDLMLARTGEPMDRNGAAAAEGDIDDKILASLLNHPFFALPAPKSLDRNAFSAAPVEGLSTADAAATLTAFTAAGIARAVELMPAAPELAVVCGGGARNPTLMRELARRLPCKVAVAETLGWSIDAMEAQAFAYMAVRRLKNLPISFPTTTGVAAPLAGGKVSRKAAAG